MQLIRREPGLEDVSHTKAASTHALSSSSHPLNHPSANTSLHATRQRSTHRHCSSLSNHTPPTSSKPKMSTTQINSVPASSLATHQGRVSARRQSTRKTLSTDTPEQAAMKKRQRDANRVHKQASRKRLRECQNPTGSRERRESMGEDDTAHAGRRIPSSSGSEPIASRRASGESFLTQSSGIFSDGPYSHRPVEASLPEVPVSRFASRSDEDILPVLAREAILRRQSVSRAQIRPDLRLPAVPGGLDDHNAESTQMGRRWRGEALPPLRHVIWSLLVT